MLYVGYLTYKHRFEAIDYKNSRKTYLCKSLFIRFQLSPEGLNTSRKKVKISKKAARLVAANSLCVSAGSLLSLCTHGQINSIP